MFKQWRHTWRKCINKADQRDHAANFRRAKGPIASLVAALLELGIHPLQPDYWDNGKGTIWMMPAGPIDMEVSKAEFI